VAISVGVVSIAVGIGVPVFYETQIDNAVSPCSLVNHVANRFSSKGRAVQ
jgi:hypothetical protein